MTSLSAISPTLAPNPPMPAAAPASAGRGEEGFSRSLSRAQTPAEPAPPSSKVKLDHGQPAAPGDAESSSAAKDPLEALGAIQRAAAARQSGLRAAGRLTQAAEAAEAAKVARAAKAALAEKLGKTPHELNPGEPVLAAEPAPPLDDSPVQGPGLGKPEFASMPEPVGPAAAPPIAPAEVMQPKVLLDPPPAGEALQPKVPLESPALGNQPAMADPPAADNPRPPKLAPIPEPLAPELANLPAAAEPEAGGSRPIVPLGREPVQMANLPAAWKPGSGEGAGTPLQAAGLGVNPRPIERDKLAEAPALPPKHPPIDEPAALPAATVRQMPAAWSPGRPAEAGNMPAAVSQVLRPTTPAAPQADASGLNGTAAQAAAAALAALPPAASALPADVLGQAALPARPGSSEFAGQLGAQVALWAKGGVQHASLQLNPLELGPVKVQIQLDGSGAQVMLAAELAATRQALEQALPTLASSLRDAGLTLTGGGVFDQARQQDGQAAAEARRNAPTATRAEPEAERVQRATLAVPRSRGVVDLMA